MLEVWDIIDSIPDTGSLDRAGLVGTAHRLVLIGGGVSGGGQDGGQQSTRRVAPDPDALGIQARIRFHVPEENGLPPCSHKSVRARVLPVSDGSR